jgi:hypothetical protein
VKINIKYKGRLRNANKGEEDSVSSALVNSLAGRGFPGRSAQTMTQRKASL